MKVTSLLFLFTVAVASSFTVDAVKEAVQNIGKNLIRKADDVESLTAVGGADNIKGLIQNNPGIQNTLNENAATPNTWTPNAAKSEGVPSNGQPTILARAASDASPNQPLALMRLPTDPEVVIKDFDTMVRENDAYKLATPEKQKLINERQESIDSSLSKMNSEELAQTMSGFKYYQLVLMDLATWALFLAPGAAVVTAVLIFNNRNITENVNKTEELQQQQQLEAAAMRRSVQLFEKD